MKNLIYFLVGLLFLVSCQDESNLETNRSVFDTSIKKVEGMQRLIVSSRNDLGVLINSMGASTNPLTRAVLEANNVQFSENEDKFVSLLEANRTNVMESLTEDQRLQIENDEDGLEYCPSDSVIADIKFAQLLNAEREIQIADTIYKYTPKGVAFTLAKNELELSKVEELSKDIDPSSQNIGKKLELSDGITFIPMNYKPAVFDTNSASVATYTSQGLKLKDGTFISSDKIREVNYKDKGDGGWLHNFFTGIFGRNVVAVNKFSSDKRLRLNFYDQNYIIYANIGTELNMQKKKFFIWWNTKGEKLVQGWETISLKYDFPKPATSYYSTNPLTGKVDAPSLFKNPFPFQDESEVLVHVPFINYDFTTKDVNKAFQTGVKAAVNAGTSWLKDNINKIPKERLGLFTSEERNIYIMFGPFSTSATQKSTLENKVYAKWFPGTYEVFFSSDNQFIPKKIKIDGNDHVELYRGSVYGAIKYKGRWLAARIIKDSDVK